MFRRIVATVGEGNANRDAVAGQTGGRFFCSEYAGIEPDLVTVAKGVAGGYPLAAVRLRNVLIYDDGLNPVLTGMLWCT